MKALEERLGSSARAVGRSTAGPPPVNVSEEDADNQPQKSDLEQDAVA